jgi:hypothetical protein
MLYRALRTNFSEGRTQLVRDKIQSVSFAEAENIDPPSAQP